VGSQIIYHMKCKYYLLSSDV